ncbi:serine/threonine protein kinase [Nematocida ausubeli]|uniref:Serine/threonine protein kinase n=1 Tax=Nematocida ausubeli (strain ATCC PRA-371 / ERTm2) TaxID=1913371 RepID=H8ZC83_NEMA1|nr:serine/threonine protein kinase [Nematocida ausubeli]
MSKRAFLSVDKILKTELQRKKIVILVATQCSILFMLIFFLFRRKNNFMGALQHTLILDKMYDLFDQINSEVDDCLKKPTRKEQNLEFSKIEILDLDPIRLSEMTAVFELKGNISDYILIKGENESAPSVKMEKIIVKRVILKIENSPEEERISLIVDNPHIMKTHFTYRCNYINHKGVDQKLLWLFIEPLNVKVSIKENGKKEDEIRHIMKDTLKGLSYLHSKNIAHLDLKLSNVMGERREDNSIIYKIIDFGFSREIPKNKVEQVYPKRCYGTFPYKPPEVWVSSIHGLSSDIWCIGAMSLFLANKKSSYFQKKTSGDVTGNAKDYTEFRSFLDGRLFIKIDTDTSPELVSFIKTCMRRNREERPTAEQLLNHEFIQGKSLSIEAARSIRYNI